METSGQYILSFGLGPKPGIIRMTEIERATALTLIKQKALETCGGYTLTFGQGGWLNAAGEIVEEDVAVVTISGTWDAVQQVAQTGKNALKRDAIYVCQPNGKTLLV